VVVARGGGKRRQGLVRPPATVASMESGRGRPRTARTKSKKRQGTNGATPELLEPDREQLNDFICTLLKHAGKDGIVSIRAFIQTDGGDKLFKMQAVPLAEGLSAVVDCAMIIARLAANAPHNVAFAWPIAVFKRRGRAREQDLLRGLVLSAECDTHAQQARKTLEAILGPPTLVVESGGTWTDETGRQWPKLHLYWRLAKPAEGKELAKLKQAREIATKLVHADESNISIVHPIRAAGSWHRKGTPKLCRIAERHDDAEIDLDVALAALKETPAGENSRSQSDSTSKKRRFKNTEPESVERVKRALAAIRPPAHPPDPVDPDWVEPDSYKVWMEVGPALYDEFGEFGFDLFNGYSKQSPKYKHEPHCSGGTECDCVSAEVEKKWIECRKITKYKIASVFHWANYFNPDWDNEEIPEHASLHQFVANAEMHNYIWLVNNRDWPAASVNARFPKQMLGGKKVTAAVWLDHKRTVQSVTWAPGLPKLILDRVVDDGGGWVDQKGDMTLNQYKPPTIKLGDASKAGPWTKLVRKVFPAEAEHIFDWLAQRAQQPGVKINHALVLGGPQGVGKDSILAGVKPTFCNNSGANWTDITPKIIAQRFNGYVKSVVLRINETHDLGEMNRYEFYESTKILTTSPPEYLPCEEKYQKRFYPVNVVGVIFTTNHKSDGIYLPPDDRRHFVAWTNLTKEDFTEQDWIDLYAWYRREGWQHIAAFLHERDISGFNPYAPPPQTEAFRDIVEANLSSEDREVAHAIDLLGETIWDEKHEEIIKIVRPPVVTISMIKKAAGAAFGNWMSEPRNNKAIGYRMEETGYVPVKNPDVKQLNRWRYVDHDGIRKFESAYAQRDLPSNKRVAAVRALLKDSGKKEPNWLIALRKNKKC
jgi:hypothetical protein